MSAFRPAAAISPSTPFSTVTINVGPKETPLTQIKMDTSSITLSVGPGGLLAQIKMDASGVTISGTPVSQLMVQPSGITTMTPTLLFGSGRRFSPRRSPFPSPPSAPARSALCRSSEGRCPRASASSPRAMFSKRSRIWRASWRRRRTTPPRSTMRARSSAPSPTAAVIFLAHLLPRREAVWWAIQCVRAMLGAGADDEALRAADAWVRTPEEDTRRAALAAFNAATRRATTWLAYAAGWSGGSVTPPDKDPMPAPPAACAQGVHTAVILAACAGDPLGILDRLKACAEAGIRFADGGDAKVRTPRPAAPRSDAL